MSCLPAITNIIRNELNRPDLLLIPVFDSCSLIFSLHLRSHVWKLLIFTLWILKNCIFFASKQKITSHLNLLATIIVSIIEKKKKKVKKDRRYHFPKMQGLIISTYSSYSCRLNVIQILFLPFFCRRGELQKQRKEGGQIISHYTSSSSKWFSRQSIKRFLNSIQAGGWIRTGPIVSIKGIL